MRILFCIVKLINRYKFGRNFFHCKICFDVNDFEIMVMVKKEVIEKDIEINYLDRNMILNSISTGVDPCSRSRLVGNGKCVLKPKLLLNFLNSFQAVC